MSLSALKAGKTAEIKKQLIIFKTISSLKHNERINWRLIAPKTTQSKLQI